MEAFPPLNPRAPFIWYGGDYNPEQWPRAVWDEDLRLMQECRFRVATVGVFSWTALQPAEERFTFGWLDQVLDKLTAAGCRVCLATPSAAQPAWLSQRYPEVLRADPTGRRRHHGWRVNYCPTSSVYRRLAAQMAAKLAERYHAHPALVAWHVSNEYAPACYCEQCAAAFRDWLRTRYGSLDELNRRWWTRFWSHTYTDWLQIEPPYANGEGSLHALTLDYRRFQNEMLLECFRLEREAIRQFSREVPITTNLMRFYRDLDYRLWAREMDVVAWDCYPSVEDEPLDIALAHDLMRSLRDGQPFLLMEQSPSSQNWQPYNTLKRPGELRLQSYQALAHGAESVMFFQWRRSRGGIEKLHGAVIEHSGRSDTRVFAEVQALGQELERLGGRTLGGVTPAQVGLLFDWENWWALEDCSGPTREKRYLETLRAHYAPFWRRNVPVDLVFSDSDLGRYRLLMAPLLYLLKEGLAERLAAFVQDGGTLVTTYLCGMVDECDLAFEDGYPGPLRHVLGIWNEEIEALPPGCTNRLVLNDGRSFACGHLCALIHDEGAEVLGRYGEDFYAGRPALTRHRVGRGQAFYLACEPEAAFLESFYGELLGELGIAPALETPPGVEATLRQTARERLLFVLNHGRAPATVTLPPGRTFEELLTGRMVSGSLSLPGLEVAILAEPLASEPSQRAGS